MRFKKFFVALIMMLMVMIPLAGCNFDNQSNNDKSDNTSDESEFVYDDNEVYLKDRYTWIAGLKLKDIFKVRLEKGGVADAPGSATVTYSTNSVDIKATYALLFNPLTPINTDDVNQNGGSYVRYDFFTNADETFFIRVDNAKTVVNEKSYSVRNFDYTFKYPDYDVNLKDRYTWIANLELNDIVKVCRVEGGLTNSQATYSTNSIDIEKAYSLLFSPVFLIDTEHDVPPSGGHFIQFDFITKSNKTFSIKIEMARLTINDKLYGVSNFNYTFQYPNAA